MVLKNCVPEDKVVVILNGINLKLFKCDGDDGGTGAVRIFAGARANKYKGILSLSMLQICWLTGTKSPISSLNMQVTGQILSNLRVSSKKNHWSGILFSLEC